MRFRASLVLFFLAVTCGNRMQRNDFLWYRGSDSFAYGTSLIAAYQMSHDSNGAFSFRLYKLPIPADLGRLRYAVYAAAKLSDK